MAATPVEMVRVRMGRPLDPEELALVVALLDQAENRLRSNPALANATERLSEDVFRANFTSVAADAVVRVLRNPEAIRQEGTGPFSATYDTRAAAGFLTILQEEWDLLLSGTDGVGMFVFGVAPAAPANLPPPFGGIPIGNGDDPSYWGYLS